MFVKHLTFTESTFALVWMSLVAHLVWPIFLVFVSLIGVATLTKILGFHCPTRSLMNSVTS